ncbi:unnamed protein product [Auanema sp. JU1783]|nr:unnamed protein product [Auanema sp. JU1783]
MTVPTKLSPFSRFVIHGHDLTTGFGQLFMTIGVQSYAILPCASLYNAGILPRLEVLTTINLLFILAALFFSSLMFALLLFVHRMFAVSMRWSERTKSILLKIFFLQWFLQIIGMAVVGLTLKDAGERGRTECIKIIDEYPIEMDTLHGVNFIPTESIEFIIIVVYGFVIVALYMNQGKSTQSAQFLANQRRISVGIIYFGAVELCGVAVPLGILGMCALLHIGNHVVAHCSLTLLTFYPIAGPYYVLMSNVDYSKRVNEIIKNVRYKLRFPRSNHKVTSVLSSGAGTSKGSSTCIAQTS